VLLVDREARLLEGLQVPVDGPAVTVFFFDQVGKGLAVLRGDERLDDAPLAGWLVTTSHEVPLFGVKSRRENARSPRKQAPCDSGRGGESTRDETTAIPLVCQGSYNAVQPSIVLGEPRSREDMPDGAIRGGRVPSTMLSIGYRGTRAGQEC